MTTQIKIPIKIRIRRATLFAETGNVLFGHQFQGPIASARKDSQNAIRKITIRYQNIICARFDLA
jgi:hypothetical protein